MPMTAAVERLGLRKVEPDLDCPTSCIVCGVCADFFTDSWNLGVKPEDLRELFWYDEGVEGGREWAHCAECVDGIETETTS